MEVPSFTVYFPFQNELRAVRSRVFLRSLTFLQKYFRQTFDFLNSSNFHFYFFEFFENCFSSLNRCLCILNYGGTVIHCPLSIPERVFLRSLTFLQKYFRQTFNFLNSSNFHFYFFEFFENCFSSLAWVYCILVHGGTVIHGIFSIPERTGCSSFSSVLAFSVFCKNISLQTFRNPRSLGSLLLFYKKS